MKRLSGGKMRNFPYHIILASNSPRRKELLAGLDLDFEVRVKPNINENYPDRLPIEEVAPYISKEKATAYIDDLTEHDLLITADTVVILDNEIMGKPKDEEDARHMLHALSGRRHQVVTGVTFCTRNKQTTFGVQTHVTFKTLSEEEIDYYVRTYRPMDKAGAYGIQEWIGYIGVTEIEGSYFNVMGLPVQRIWEELTKFQ